LSRNINPSDHCVELFSLKGVLMNVNEHGGYKIGTKVGQIKGYMSRNQVQFVANATLDVSEVPVSDRSVREIVSKSKINIIYSMHKLLHFVLNHSRNQLCLLVAT
jgi:hypothetical protein